MAAVSAEAATGEGVEGGGVNNGNARDGDALGHGKEDVDTYIIPSTTNLNFLPLVEPFTNSNDPQAERIYRITSKMT
jgi:hypothetical protein